MLGIIGVYQHRIDCIIGIHPHERRQEQKIFVDVKVKIDFDSCIISEALSHTINYVEIAQLCTQLAQEKKYCLLEALAHDILERLINEFKVQWAWICIKKPSAIETAEYAFVELERTTQELI